ncbi:MAG TPA: hypothetical protein VGF44_00725 [Terriglobales bacterium]|jgi:hypothetical protein
MGKLLFVNTNRTNGISGIVICGVLIAFGIWALLDGGYYSVLGILLILLGIAGVKFFLKITTQKTEIYEQGFISKNMFGSVSGRYTDLKSIVCGAVTYNGVLNTSIHLVTNSGGKVTVSNEKFLKNDDKMDLLLQCASGALAEVWAKKLESQTEVVWLMNGSTPQVKIRKEGLCVDGKAGMEIFIPFGEIQFKPGFALQIQLLNGAGKVATLNSDAANYYVGLALIARLIDHQQRSMAATTRS